MGITKEYLLENYTYDSSGLLLEKSGKPTKCYFKKDGYVICYIKGKLQRLHRLIFLYHHGYMPKMIDHINQNRADNRVENLRECTNQQNMANTTAYSTNKLGVKGVRRHKGKFQANITVNYKSYCLGSYETVELAKECYDLAASVAFGEFARQ